MIFESISGAHFNPAVTFIGMINPLTKFPKKVGFLYILMQLLGALAGITVSYLVLYRSSSPALMYETVGWILKDFISELFGTFCFLTILLI